jgi:hypothetical protein
MRHIINWTKATILTGIFVSVWASMNAQGTEEALDTKDVTRSLTAASAGVGVTPTGMRTLPIKEEAMRGDFYLNKEYADITLAVIDEESYILNSKYNIRNNVFVVQKEGGGLGSLDGKMVEQFKYKDEEGEHNLISTLKYPFNPMEASPGFYEVLFNSSGVQLLIRHRIQVIDANYNVALDVGERSGRIEVIKRYYFYQQGAFSEIKNFKKKNMLVFGDLSKEMTAYVKNENLQPNNETDLISVVKRYDFLRSNRGGTKNSAGEK